MWETQGGSPSSARTVPGEGACGPAGESPDEGTANTAKVNQL